MGLSINQFTKISLLLVAVELILVFVLLAIYFSLRTDPSTVIKNKNPNSKVAARLISESKLREKNPLAFIASVKSAKATRKILSETTRGAVGNKTASASIPFWDQERAFSSFKRNYDLFKFVSLFWYNLRSDGSIKKYIYAVEDRNIIKFAHSKGTKVLALIANLPDEDEAGDWDYKRVDKVIGNNLSRKKHIADIVALTKKLGFDGINIDYEALRKYQKDNFTTFIKELSEEMHKNGKIVGVALHPKISEGDPAYSNGSEAQDWRKLGRYADQLHLMTYEEHWETSPAGPMASLPWVSSVLNYARGLIPPEKLFAGVPLDGYDWSNTPPATGLVYQDVLNLINKYKPRVLWDKKSQTKHFGYSVGSITHSVWYEDDDSFRAKLNLFKNLGVSNLTIWRLGGEDPRVWQTLRNYK